jgi:hypothetical protein
MSGAAGRYTILESWPMIREDFEAFTKDPTQWFADQFEQAARKKDWEQPGGNAPQPLKRLRDCSDAFRLRSAVFWLRLRPYRCL